MEDWRRLVGWFTVALLMGCEVAGEIESPPAPDRFERPCRRARECPGNKCIVLGENAQGVWGLCSQPCRSSVDCGEGSICFALGKAGPTCLATCDGQGSEEEDAATQGACMGGLACVPVGLFGEAACFVEPLSPGAAST